jgi:hypothetical protein
MKRCLSLVIKEMETEATISDHQNTSITMAIQKSIMEIPSTEEDAQKLQFIRCW